jgi:hypothetical protein
MKDENTENKSSESGRDVKRGNQPSRVSSVERVGSHGGHGVSFGLPDHPDKSVVSKGKLKE